LSQTTNENDHQTEKSSQLEVRRQSFRRASFLCPFV
jgi:hypothetical protein